MSSTRAREVGAPVPGLDPWTEADRGPESLVVLVHPGFPHLPAHTLHGHRAAHVEAPRLVGRIAPLLPVQSREARRQVRHAVELTGDPAAAVQDHAGILAEVVQGAADPP